MPPQDSAGVQAVTRQAQAAFDRTTTALGQRLAPQSEKPDHLQPILGFSIEHAGERTDGTHSRRIRLPR
jgi:hypothetical protein